MCDGVCVCGCDDDGVCDGDDDGVRVILER